MATSRAHAMQSYHNHPSRRKDFNSPTTPATLSATHPVTRHALRRPPRHAYAMPAAFDYTVRDFS